MSQIPFIILCKKCKKVEFNQGNTNLRNCPSCRITGNKKMRKRYNLKRRQNKIGIENIGVEVKYEKVRNEV